MSFHELKNENQLCHCIQPYELNVGVSLNMSFNYLFKIIKIFCESLLPWPSIFFSLANSCGWQNLDIRVKNKIFMNNHEAQSPLPWPVECHETNLYIILTIQLQQKIHVHNFPQVQFYWQNNQIRIPNLEIAYPSTKSFRFQTKEFIKNKNRNQN